MHTEHVSQWRLGALSIRSCGVREFQDWAVGEDLGMQRLGFGLEVLCSCSSCTPKPYKMVGYDPLIRGYNR